MESDLCNVFTLIFLYVYNLMVTIKILGLWPFKGYLHVKSNDVLENF